MIDYFFINKAIIISVTIFGVLLAFLVYFSNRKSKTNQLFLIMVIFALAWIMLCYFSGINIENLKLSLLLARLAYGTAILFLIPLYYFFSIFIDKQEQRGLFHFFIFIGSVTISIFSIFTDFMATHMVSAEILGVDIGVVPVLGYGKYIWFIFAIFIAVVVIVKIFKKYLTSSISEKIQLQYFLLGTFIFLIATLIFNVILPLFFGDARYYQFGNLSVIFLLGFTAYAIVKRNLFDIKVVLTTLFVGLIAILLLLDALIFTENLSFQFFKGIILIIFIFFGRYLIKSVQLEIRRREELESLTTKLEITNIKLVAAYKKLEKLDKAKSEFVSIASHQLRTPLTAIKGYLSMIIEKSYGKPTKDMKNPLENIYASNERLIKLVNDLLSISRIEAGKITLELKEDSPEELISDIIKELEINANKKNIYLKFEKAESSLPKIMIDRDKLRQVIMNVIDNAIRYTQKGEIVVSCFIENEKFKILIKDTGEGMVEEEINKLFETFSRGKAGTKSWTEGAGLGLYIAKKFIEMHKGKIWAESVGKNKGSQFYIELPLIS